MVCVHLPGLEFAFTRKNPLMSLQQRLGDLLLDMLLRLSELGLNPKNVFSEVARWSRREFRQEEVVPVHQGFHRLQRWFPHGRGARTRSSPLWSFRTFVHGH